MTLLSLESIGVSFKAPGTVERLAILVDVSLAVEAGMMVAVVGRSGSGKTTLLHVAAGLQSPDVGTVRWMGEGVAAMSATERARYRRRHVGVVFQSASLIGSLTAAENVAVPGMPDGVRGSGSKRAAMLLDEVGLAHRGRHFPSQMSGGEQQRTAFARALYSDPGLLLVDEPTANLDKTTAAGIIELMVDLRSARRGMLVATHDAALASRADCVMSLD